MTRIWHDCTRAKPALVADTSLSGRPAVRELDAIAAGRGHPEVVVSDNGTELTGMAVLAWRCLIDQPWRIMSIGPREWAHGF